ncbi:MAG: hypothetical protein AAF921_05940 [Cyanobacteria bacterium P01_D01_bin.44]
MQVNRISLSQINDQLKTLGLDAILSIEDVYYYADVFESLTPQRLPSAAVATPSAI